MRSIKIFVAVTALSTISLGTFAQNISASTSTLDRAEAKIAAQAVEQGASYKITSARLNNRIHITAELTRQNRHIAGPPEETGDSDNTMK